MSRAILLVAIALFASPASGAFAPLPSPAQALALPSLAAPPLTLLDALRLPGMPEDVPAPPPAFHDLQSAIDAFLGRHGERLGEEDRATLAAVPAPLALSLQRIVAAFMAAEDASALAEREGEAMRVLLAERALSATVLSERAVLREACSVLPLPADAIGEARGVMGALPDHPLFVAMKPWANDTLNGTRQFLTPPNGTFGPFGALYLDLSCRDSEIVGDTRLAIDLGGHDQWRNNAGGSFEAGAFLALDVDGDDVYADQNPTRPPLVTGNGLLLPSGTRASHGSTDRPMALGMLLDLGDGDDMYLRTADEGRVAANGAALDGFALLYDEGGNDTYVAHLLEGAANGALLRHNPVVQTPSLAVLFDNGAGADRHEVRLAQRGAGIGAFYSHLPITVAPSVAMLADMGGDDEYAASITAPALQPVWIPTGSGGFSNSVIFVGNSSVARGAFQGAAMSSLWGEGTGPPFRGLRAGILYDVGDDSDSFVANGTAQGAASGRGSLGLLVNAGANASYRATADAFAQGAGNNSGVGLLLDSSLEVALALDAGARGQASASNAGLGIVLLTHPEGQARFEAANGSEPGRVDTLGVGLRVAVGASTSTGLLSDLSCRGSASIERSVEVAGRTSTVRVCAPDESMSAPLPSVTLPNSTEQIPGNSVPKPAVPCSGICAQLVGALLGPEAAAWLEETQLTWRASGGTAIHLSDATTAWTTYHMATADNVCRVSCHTIGVLAAAAAS